MPRTNFRPPYSRRLHIKFGQAVSEGKMLEIVDDDNDDERTDERTDDGQTDAGPWVYYKLTYEHSAQVS